LIEIDCRVSVCMITPAIASFPPRTATAIASAAWANSAS
jgi:hypothetical protein